MRIFKISSYKWDIKNAIKIEEKANGLAATRSEISETKKLQIFKRKKWSEDQHGKCWRILLAIPLILLSYLHIYSFAFLTPHMNIIIFLWLLLFSFFQWGFAYRFEVFRSQFCVWNAKLFYTYIWVVTNSHTCFNVLSQQRLIDE